MLAIMRFWLDRGIDGFRLDVVNFYFHDTQLRDNPVRDPQHPMAGVTRTNPYAWQDPVRSQTHPANLAFLEEMRALADRHNAVLIGEIGPDSDAGATMAAYTAPDRRLHMAYSFALLSAPFTPAAIRAVVQEARDGESHPCWALANHDVVRTRTRFDLEADPDAGALLTTALVTSLAAPACLYQGEELGLPEAEIPYDAMRDPYGIRFWPDQPGRDGCRTPMPWRADAPHAGFSLGDPWLPIPDSHLLRSVESQKADPDSGLSRIRRFLRWRAHEPLLCEGGLRFRDAPAPFLAIQRENGPDADGARLLGLFHLGAAPQRLTPGMVGLERWGEPVADAMSNAVIEGDALVFPGPVRCRVPASVKVSGRGVSRTRTRRATAASRAGLPPIGETVRAMRDAPGTRGILRQILDAPARPAPRKARDRYRPPRFPGHNAPGRRANRAPGRSSVRAPIRHNNSGTCGSIKAPPGNSTGRVGSGVRTLISANMARQASARWLDQRRMETT